MLLLRSIVFTVAALALVGGATACSDDTEDDAREALESAGDDAGRAIDRASARAVAQAIAAALKVNQTADDEGVRSVEAIEEVVDQLPGDPDVSGIDDGDGDGMDDDGKVQVTADDEQACVVLPERGENTSVEQGAC